MSPIGWRRLVRWTLAATLAVAVSPAAWAGAQAGLKVAQLPIRTDGPKNLDPAKGSTTYDNMACSQIYETLMQVSYLKRPETIEPLLISEMPTITNHPDGTQTWSFTLKKGVRFHDDPCFPAGKGREITADDVFYSWKRLADPANDYENWWLLKDTIVGLDEYKDEQKKLVDAGKPFDYDAPVAGLVKKSDLQFDVVLRQPVTRFRWVMTMFQTSVVPREAVEKYGSRFSVRPVGTGPFIVKDEGDWKPGQSLTLTRNPNYHECYYPTEWEKSDEALGLHLPAGQRIPFLDRIEITMYPPDPPMWLDFQSGKLGFIQVPAEYFEQAFDRRTQKLKPDFAKRGIVGHAVPLLDFIFRGFNMEDPLLGGYTEEKKALRQAISLAMDLEEFNESFYNGINIVYDGPIPPGLDGHPEDGQAPVSYRGPDIDLAKELLAKAGYPDGKGLPQIDYFVAASGNEGEQSNMMVRQLKQIGVNINPKLVPFSELIETVNKKKAPMFGFAWGSDYPDGENNLALFYSPNVSPGSNHYNYNRPEYDRMYEQILVMEPGPERTAIMEKMRDMLIEDTPYVGSMARTRFYVINPWLKNFKPTEDFYNWMKYLDVDDTKRPR